MITVNSKGVTCKWTGGKSEFMPWQSVGDWFEVEEETNDWCGQYPERYDDFLTQIDKYAKDIKAICGNGNHNGIFIKFSKNPPDGYVHTIEFAAAYSGADELDYIEPKVLRVWWD